MSKLKKNLRLTHIPEKENTVFGDRVVKGSKFITQYLSKGGHLLGSNGVHLRNVSLQ